MFFLLFLLIYSSLGSSTLEKTVLHLPIHRRGGRFAHHEPANLTKSSQLLQRIENRYSRTYRDAEANRLVRRWAFDRDNEAMLDEIGIEGTWYTKLSIGEPPQLLEVDLDFLSTDFYTLLTTSTGGSKFNTFTSQSHVPGNTFVHPLCRLSSDHLHLLHTQSPTSLDWPICQPSKSSRHTLSNSGTVLGLAPNSGLHKQSLSRTGTPSFAYILHQKKIIRSTVWSIAVVDSTTGILSLGGTLAAEIEEVKARTEVELKYLGQADVASQVEGEVRGKMAFAMPEGSTHEDHFKWTDVSGPNGWWTGLMGGVWVDGVKVLKNQPFLIDLSCPFIIAPPTAFDSIYNSIGGTKPVYQSNLNGASAKSLGETQLSDSFRLFPCLNPPSISLELAGWPFRLSSLLHSTPDDAMHGPAGGPFSLGKIEEYFDVSPSNDSNAREISGVNSGFCVGIIVKSDMGERQEKKWQDSGMRDVWVLGEPFFRGMGIAFDNGDGTAGSSGKARVGFRNY